MKTLTPPQKKKVNNVMSKITLEIDEENGSCIVTAPGIEKISTASDCIEEALTRAEALLSREKNKEKNSGRN